MKLSPRPESEDDVRCPKWSQIFKASGNVRVRVCVQLQVRGCEKPVHPRRIQDESKCPNDEQKQRGYCKEGREERAQISPTRTTKPWTEEVATPNCLRPAARTSWDLPARKKCQRNTSGIITKEKSPCPSHEPQNETGARKASTNLSSSRSRNRTRRREHNQEHDSQNHERMKKHVDHVPH